MGLFVNITSKQQTKRFIFLPEKLKKISPEPDVLRSPPSTSTSTSCPYTSRQNEQGPSSRTQEIHGQNDLPEVERRSAGGGHPSGLRPLHEPGGWRHHRGQEDRREEQHRDGRSQGKLSSHARSHGTNLISHHPFDHIISHHPTQSINCQLNRFLSLLKDWFSPRTLVRFWICHLFWATLKAYNSQRGAW